MSSPFSFHCMICFEGFDIETRYPVVLPCGHTYVCNQCSERLDKCMECRTSLFYVIPRPQPAADPLTSRYGGRGRQSQTPTKPQPPIKKRLPLPKNVVLMSLIEATELAAENVRNQAQQPSLTESPMLSIPSSILDVEEDEEEKIRAGTSLAISDAGTYAVSAREGLEIYPSCPDVASGPSHNQTESEEDVDTLVRFFHLENKLDPSQASNSENNGAPPARLSLGDRVQIVCLEGGWAKLSRGYGFVRADGQKLVKVGGSVDRACKLEAMLRLLSARRNSLRGEQTRVDNQFITLMSELQVSLMTDEDLTVIAADTFRGKHSSKTKSIAIETSLAEVRDNESSGHPNGQEVRSINSEDTTPLKPRPTERIPTPPPSELSRSFLCGSATDVFDTIMPLGGSTESRQPQRLPNVMQTPAVSQLLTEASQQRISSSIEAAAAAAAATSTPTRSITSTPQGNPSPSALKAGARAWREMHGRAASAHMGIDFRTGMSGHAALTSINTHPHDYLEEPAHTTSFRGMSNHTALTMWKPFRRQQQAVNSLAMPTYRGQSGDDGSTVDSSSILSSTH